VGLESYQLTVEHSALNRGSCLEVQTELQHHYIHSFTYTHIDAIVNIVVIINNSLQSQLVK